MKVHLRYFEFKTIFHTLFVFLIILNKNGLLSEIQHRENFVKSEIKMKLATGKDGVNYVCPEIKDLDLMSEFGKPTLPVKYIKLLIPAQKDVASIKFIEVKEEILPGDYLIYPAQKAIPLSDGYPMPEFIPPDPVIYESEAPFPKERVKVIDDGYFDGSNHIITLAIYPLQYSPRSGKLSFAQTINFELIFKENTRQILKVRARSSDSQNIYNAILKGLVVNSQDIPLYQYIPPDKKVLKKSKGIKSGVLPAYKYVIITNEALKPVFGPFVSWKVRKGLDVGIITIEEICSNYSGDLISGIFDDAGKVRQYLSDAYLDGTMWVLLAGDYTIVPTRYGDKDNNSNWSGDQWAKIPADLYFADFNGDWNVDSDN